MRFMAKVLSMTGYSYDVRVPVEPVGKEAAVVDPDGVATGELHKVVIVEVELGEGR